MASILEMMGHIQDQGDRGRQTGLSRLIGDAYRDPSKRQESLGRVAQFDGQAAFNAQAMFEKMDDTGRQRLGQRMAVFSALPDDIKAQAYPDIAREAQALGIPAPGEWNPEFAPHMQKIAQALGAGSQQAEQFTLGPGSKRFDPSGKVIAEVPFAPANANLVTVPDGQGGAVQMIYDPRTRQLSEPQYPGQGQPAAAAPAGAGAATQIMGDAFSGAQIDPV